MHTGKITELTDRHSGFIRRTGIAEDLFFHADDLVGNSFADLRPGDKVSFSVTQSLKGSYAVLVTKLA